MKQWSHPLQAENKKRKRLHLYIMHSVSLNCTLSEETGGK